VSERQPRERYVQIEAVELCYFEWGERSSAAPTYLFSHATGFHGRCWDETIRALPADAHALALEVRGHGRSAQQPPYDWLTFGDDLRQFIEILGLTQIIGVGHSMGGHCMVQAAAGKLNSRFERLVLIDPVIMDPAIYTAGSQSRHGFIAPSDHPASRRKAEFSDWQEMYDRFAQRDPFSLWQPQVLRDYCRYGLLPAENGRAQLACPPIVEASVYVGNAGCNIHPLPPQISQQVSVLRARERSSKGDREPMDFSSSPTWPRLAAAFPHGADIYLPTLTHFISMQAPLLVARCAMEAVTDVQSLAPELAGVRGS
jgi:pimeloyl-ACP methyl ester carboxylesterase